jgi:NADH:ubiquinone oxidoreductase subunit F (NADH-binding)
LSTVAKSAPPKQHRQAIGTRLLAGPDSAKGWERLADHQRRLGARRPGGQWLLDVLKQSGLRGRGGAWFPTWRKWQAVTEKTDGHAVVVINGSEGEPLSSKDRVLLQLRPHVVFDGAAYAAETVGADAIVLYLSRQHKVTERILNEALKERRKAGLAEPPIRIETTAHRYVAGESSAVISRVSGEDSKPRWSLMRSAEKGVHGAPTLVQNAETIAHSALIARYGAEWFRKLGTEASPGTTLMTLCGNVRHPGVYEVDLSATLGDVIYGVGGPATPPAGALLGGYFGTWLPPQSIEDMPLDVDRMRKEHNAAMGCGVLALLPQNGCAIAESTRILTYLAAESAGQCGPCIHGLAALAEAMQRITASTPESGDLERVRRWIDMVKGRGACKHPDGAIGQLVSALTNFEGHLRMHLYGQPCYGGRVQGFPPPPAPGSEWK